MNFKDSHVYPPQAGNTGEFSINCIFKEVVKENSAQVDLNIELME